MTHRNTDLRTTARTALKIGLVAAVLTAVSVGLMIAVLGADRVKLHIARHLNIGVSGPMSQRYSELTGPWIDVSSILVVAVSPEYDPLASAVADAVERIPEVEQAHVAPTTQDAALEVARMPGLMIMLGQDGYGRDAPQTMVRFVAPGHVLEHCARGNSAVQDAARWTLPGSFGSWSATTDLIDTTVLRWMPSLAASAIAGEFEEKLRELLAQREATLIPTTLHSPPARPFLLSWLEDARPLFRSSRLDGAGLHLWLDARTSSSAPQKLWEGGPAWVSPFRPQAILAAEAAGWRELPNAPNREYPRAWEQDGACLVVADLHGRFEAYTDAVAVLSPGSEEERRETLEPHIESADIDELLPYIELASQEQQSRFFTRAAGLEAPGVPLLVSLARHHLRAGDTAAAQRVTERAFQAHWHGDGLFDERLLALAEAGLAPQASPETLEAIGFVPMAREGYVPLDEIVEHRAQGGIAAPLRVYYEHPDPRGGPTKLRWMSLHIEEAPPSRRSWPQDHVVVRTAHSDRNPFGVRDLIPFDAAQDTVQHQTIIQGVDARLDLIPQAQGDWEMRLFQCIDSADVASEDLDCWGRLAEHDQDASSINAELPYWRPYRIDALVFRSIVFAPLLPVAVALTAWLGLFGVAVRRSPERHPALMALFDRIRPQAPNSAALLGFWLVAGTVMIWLWLSLYIAIIVWSFSLQVPWLEQFLESAYFSPFVYVLFGALYAGYTWFIGARHRDDKLLRLIVAVGGTMGIAYFLSWLREVTFGAPDGSLSLGHLSPIGKIAYQTLQSPLLTAFATAAICLLAARFDGVTRSRRN